MLALNLTKKYGDQLGSNCLDVLLFECDKKVLEGFFEFWTLTCFIFIQLRIFSSSLLFVDTYISFLLSPLVYSSNEISLKKELYFFKVLLPWNRAKLLPSLVLIISHWHKCWKWQAWKIQSKNLSWSLLLMTFRLTMLSRISSESMINNKQG